MSPSDNKSLSPEDETVDDGAGTVDDCTGTVEVSVTVLGGEETGVDAELKTGVDVKLDTGVEARVEETELEEGTSELEEDPEEDPPFSGCQPFWTQSSSNSSTIAIDSSLT